MYNWFFIEKNIWNNSFSFNERKNKKLWVAPLKKIAYFSEIELQDDKTKIAFEDYDFDGKLSTNFGLKNFYEIEKNNKKIYIFDNHNHALYFWFLERNSWFIKDENILYHIDEHADYRDPKKYLLKPDSLDNKKIFEYVNFSKINVWNYIIPAEKEGIIKKTIQIRSEFSLNNFLENLDFFQEQKNIILNIDLDFFCENLDFIDFELKKKVIQKIFKKSKLITISTSPFFISQKLALQKLKDLEIL